MTSGYGVVFGNLVIVTGKEVSIGQKHVLAMELLHKVYGYMGYS